MKTFLTSLKGKLIVGLSTLGVVGAVIAAAVIINSGYRTIVVDGSNGSTEIVNGSDVNEAYVGLHLKSGDDVTVKNTSDLTLALDQDKYVYAEENTHFWIEAKGKTDDTRTVINLDEGCNLIRIDQKLRESESFEVDTPNTTVSVRGTVYRVTCRQEANGDTYTIIEVFEGEVYVAVKMENGQDTGESRYLQAGESAIVRSNSSISEFVKNEKDGTPVHPIHYSTIPQNTAKQLGRIIDSGRKLCISKELLFDIVELIEHEFTKEAERVEPTCKEPGYVKWVCDICDEEEEKEVLPPVEHEYEYIDYPETDDHPAYREKKCKLCDEVFETIEDPEKEHKYGEWIIVKQPTCTEDGLKEAICEECGAKTEEVIPKLNHRYKDTKDPATGKPIKKCERCDKEIEAPDNPTAPQNPVEEILNKERKDTGNKDNPSTPDSNSGSDSPDSSDDGDGGQNNESQDDGSQNDDENENPAPQKNPPKKDACANGHDYQPDSVEPATCTEAGKRTEKCSRCGETKETTIAATGHTAVSSKDNKAATCTAAGLQGKTECSKCGTIVSAGTEVAATGHTAVSSKDNKAATCTAAGLQGKTECSKCGTVVSAGTEVAATGHTAVASKDNKAATCTVAGLQGKTECSKCGAVVNAGSEIAATGHTEVVSKDNKAATCTVAGLQGKTECSKCGAVVNAGTALAATGHDYETTGRSSATCTEPAKETRTCKICSESNDVEVGPALGHDFEYISADGAGTQHQVNCKNGCGYSEYEDHTSSGGYEKDPYEHWYKCGKCEAEFAKETHTRPADGSENCTKCGPIPPG